MSAADEMERCRPWLEAALEYTGGTHSWADLVEAVQRGRMQLWPGAASAALTELLQYPQRLSVNVFLAGGDLDEILAAIPDVQAWAREQGCSDMTMTGRPGWEKVLARTGWAKTMTTMGTVL